ncbi:thioredoxin domain-containing protein [Acetobacter fabarum]|uniref:hydrogenase n=1 Tax=Acetobacter fabarum TaxID=483199 RepID=UPI00209D63EC|nr:hydrogenase [Acetobacter fabarum]MCP1228881.1 hydrogenase [Acetobacter fabarum]MCP1234376.1 hydrogenase [Acetobacter fabarum]
MSVLELPLVQGLTTRHGMPVLHTLEQAQAGYVLLLLPSHARIHLETPDLAAILPDLLQLGAVHLRNAQPISGAVADAALEAELVRNEGDLSLPALVVLENGQVKASIARMRDWDTYVSRFGALFAPSTTADGEPVV